MEWVAQNTHQTCVRMEGEMKMVKEEIVALQRASVSFEGQLRHMAGSDAVKALQEESGKARKATEQKVEELARKKRV